jgi:hypothetical protein
MPIPAALSQQINQNLKLYRRMLKNMALALLLIAPSLFAQPPVKEQKRLERAEKRRVRDSIAAAKDNIYWEGINRKDSLRREYWKKEGATSIIAQSSAPASDALSAIARALIKSGFIIQVDKEYGAINTEPQWGNGASYTLHYYIESTADGCMVKGMTYAHGQVGAFSLGLGIATSKTIDLRMEYGGDEKSTCMIAFRQLHKHLEILPDAVITYNKDDAQSL